MHARPVIVGLAVMLGVGAAAVGLRLAVRHDRRPHPRVGPRYFSDWSPPVAAQCSLGADRGHGFDEAKLEGSLAYAAAHALVLHSNGHGPTLDLDSYAPAFAYARAHGVTLLTYRELAGDRTPRAGWAFSIDDDDIDTWYGWRDRLRAWHVHMTFFVSGYGKLTPAQIAELHALAGDGHDIEPHGVDHLDAKWFTSTRTVDEYVAQQIAPEVARMIADGFAPVAFAYPFGSHTPALDGALGGRFALLRTTAGPNCY